MPGCRLLSTFRAVYGGVRHERLKLLPYGGQAVRPRPVPVPRRAAGRGRRGRTTPATPLPIDNRTVLHLLRSLQYLEMRGEARTAELPGSRHRADRPRLRGPARPHRQAGDRADAQPDRRQGGRARGRRLGTGAAPGEGGGRPAQVPQGADGPVGERAQEGPGESASSGDAAKKLRAACGRRGVVQPGAAVLGAGPQRHVRPAGGHPQGVGVRHGGDGSARPAARTTRPAA